MIRIGFLYSRLRVEERMIMEEIKRRNNVELVRLYDSDIVFEVGRHNIDVDIILSRSISHLRTLYALEMFESLGIPTVNSADVVRTCGDKFLTNLALRKNNIPTPRVMIAFTPESALEGMNKMGYPCVLKPIIGSWGRLLAKVENEEIARSILEHKSMLGATHSVFYIQEYIPKLNNRDIRAFVIGNKCITAIYRTSENWITNTARGGKVDACPIDKVSDISIRAAQAVGGGIVAIDLFETSKGFLVNEVNHTMEFRNSMHDVDIPKMIVDYVIGVARR